LARGDHLTRANTDSELATDRPDGLSDEVLSSRAVPVRGAAMASDVEPPPFASTVNNVSVTVSRDKPMADRAVTTSYQESLLA